MHFLIIIIEINIFQSSTGTHLSEVFNRKSCLHVLFRNFFIARFIIRLRIFHLYAHIHSHISIIVQNSKVCEQMKTEVTTLSILYVYSLYVSTLYVYSELGIESVLFLYSRDIKLHTTTVQTHLEPLQPIYKTTALHVCLSLCSKESAHAFS